MWTIPVGRRDVAVGVRADAGWRLALASALIASAVACATVRRPTPLGSLPVADTPPKQGDWQYKIHVGDELDVKFFFNAELNEHLTVRPDGRISLQLVPEIVAAGLTPGELAQRLKDEYSGELSKPELTVIMRSFGAQQVYVGGEVEKPGEMRLTGTLTALQAVAIAAGFKDTARLTEVIVIRRNPDRTPLVIPVNLKRALDGTDVGQDIALMPYDVLYVPKSTLANVNKFVDQLIRKNIPLNFGFVIRGDVETIF
jgi:protein involved in polysaccharide export with SLBB domain